MYEEKLERAKLYAKLELDAGAPKIEGTLDESNLREGYVDKVIAATQCDRNAAIFALRNSEKTMASKVSKPFIPLTNE